MTGDARLWGASSFTVLKNSGNAKDLKKANESISAVELFGHPAMKESPFLTQFRSEEHNL